MTPLAAPSPVQPSAHPASPDADPASGNAHFNDTLKQAQPRQAKGGAAEPASHGSDRDRHHPATKSDPHEQTDKHSDAETSAAPTAIAALVPGLLRQPLAASGNPPPSGPAVTAAAVAGRPTTPSLPKLPGINSVPAQLAAAQPEPLPTDSQVISAAATQLKAGASSAEDIRHALESSPQSLLQLSGHLAGAQPATANQPLPQPHVLTMQSTPDAPQFAQETAQHVVWLSGQTIKQAQIQLNPPQLGPIHVDVATDHGRVDVTFAVQHPQTVHALQQTLPQLHDMLAQQGLSLGHASVGQQAPQQQQTAHAFPGDDARRSRTHEADMTISPLQSRRAIVPGGVDDFA